MSRLWELVWGRPEVDPASLAYAIEQEARGRELDQRTMQLIAEGTQALESYWGAERVAEWLNGCTVRQEIESIRKKEFQSQGFPTLKDRLMEKFDLETLYEFLRELGSVLREPVTLRIGGSIALIQNGLLERATEDVDVVDEIPDEIRAQNVLLDRLKKRYGIYIAHFQSHYLPEGWQARLHDGGTFGQIKVLYVDPYDIAVGKLFSRREKDRDDLRMLKRQFEKEELVKRLETSCTIMLQDPGLKANAETNWYVLFGEKLPVDI